MPPFQKHLFMCINERKADDPRGCCTSRGAPALLDYIKKRVHDSGLKGKVRINKAGCLDACAQGPSLVIYPDEIWYSPKTEQDMEDIFTEHIQNNRIVERLVSTFPAKKN